jgi:hypothetical protein
MPPNHWSGLQRRREKKPVRAAMAVGAEAKRKTLGEIPQGFPAAPSTKSARLSGWIARRGRRRARCDHKAVHNFGASDKSPEPINAMRRVARGRVGYGLL